MMEENVDLDNEDVCGICYAEFLDIDDLKLHITQYHLNESSKNRFCKLCSRIFPDIDSYALHIRNAHLSTLKICKYCTRVFKNNRSLSKHEKKHKSSIYYPKIACSHCIRVFKNKTELENHEYEKHRETDEGFMLQHCFPELSSLVNINIRKFFNGLHENYLYKCVACEHSTLNVNDYIYHLITKKCQSLSCNVCCNVYAWKSRLKYHCNSHKESQDTVIDGKKICPKCDKLFHITKLKSHSKECTSMKCIPCDVSFDTVDKFAQHVTTHSHRAPVQFNNCKYCRRPFIGLNAVQKHIERSHKHNLHLYKYNCIYCDIVFKHPKLLFGHFFSKHRDISPYKCKICNLEYRIRRNFTLHIKLDHKSVGFVEFDSNFHVFFTDKKSEKPFQPKNPDLDLSENTVEEVIIPTDDNEITTDNNEVIINASQDETTEAATALDIDENPNVTSNNSKETIELEFRKETQLDQILQTTDAVEIVDIEAQASDEYEVTDTDVLKQLPSEALADKSEDIPCDSIKETTLKKKDDATDSQYVSEVQLVNINSDFMDVTDTEADRNKKDTKRKPRVQKRKIKVQVTRSRKKRKIKNDCNSSDDSDVPLSRILNKTKCVKKIKRRKKKAIKEIPRNRKKMKLICYKCNRNCYTYQNYHRHISMHMNNTMKVCVKCFGKFKTKVELEEHMKAKHSSSQLTETLKKVLEKRKNNINVTASDSVVAPERIFSKTIQKVEFEPHHSQATIKKVEDRLSVKKFLETFKPDTDPTSKKISISNDLCIRSVTTPRTESVIKMKKFNPDPITTDRPQLRKPVKFREEETQEHKVTIRLVNCAYVTPTINFDNEVTVTDDDCMEDHNESAQCKTDSIPEVGREVLLEQTKPSKVKLNKKTIVLKDILSYNNVSIGHLAPNAPFFKIVKINEVLENKQKKVEPPKEINITLPNGTKLVSVNPLAHLLGNKSVSDIPKANPYKNKSYGYKSKMQDFKEAIIKAIKVLDKTPPKRKSKKNIEKVETVNID